jgi:hypothetical protein
MALFIVDGIPINNNVYGGRLFNKSLIYLQIMEMVRQKLIKKILKV